MSLPNTAPTAGPSGPFATFVDTATTVFLAASDLENDALTYTIVAPPANGVLSGEGGSQEYTPTAGFTGTDSFIYQVSDGVNSSDAAIVEITVAALPAPIVNETRTLDDIEGLI
ncbi:MAG: cadherin-like domain-containing protein, partial [Gemmatimonadales bacterium]|nr:cadherin-like domain-containing protein [Gemmatimonadales bacterium]